jgi:hypothetical protein
VTQKNGDSAQKGETMSDSESATQGDNRTQDRREIDDLLHRYCRAVDRLDIELLKSVYFEDSYDNHGVFAGNGWELADFIIPFMRDSYLSTMHVLGNRLVEFDAEGLARGEVYFCTYHRVDNSQQLPGQQLLEHLGARYIDRYERRAGEWRISYRAIVVEFITSHVIVATPAWERMLHGSRSKEDLCYRVATR